MVAFKDYKLNDEKLRAVYLPKLLEALELNMEEFRDLCILLKCDYNKRVKISLSKARDVLPLDEFKDLCASVKRDPDNYDGKTVPIGWNTAVKLIDTYRKLEVIEAFIDDIEPLRYERCRELFTPINSSELKELIETRPYSKKPDIPSIADFIARENLNGNLVEYIETCWKPVELIFDESSGEDEEDKHLKSYDERVNDYLKSCARSKDIYVKLIARLLDDEEVLEEVEFYACFSDKSKFDAAIDSSFSEYIEAFNAWISDGGEKTIDVDNLDCEVLMNKPENVKILSF